MTPSHDVNALLGHGRFLRRLARDLLGDEQLAEDAVQETWIRALRSKPGRKTSLRGWLATIIRNLARDRWRSDRSRKERERGAARPEASADLSETYERYELQRRVARMVDELEEPFRTAVLLRYLEELSSAEIAARLEVPTTTVRTRVHRGLERLRQKLDRAYGDDRRAWAILLLPLFTSRPLPPTPVPPPEGTLWARVLCGGAAVAAALLVVLAVRSFRSETSPRNPVRSAAAPENTPSPEEASESRSPKSSPRRTVRGRVVRPDGTIAPNARVSLARAGKDVGWVHEWLHRGPKQPEIATVQTDDRGRFEIAVPFDGAATLLARVEGAAGRRTVGPSTHRGIVVRLRATLGVSFRVVNEEGTPVQGATIRIGPIPFVGRDEEVTHLVTDANGRAETPNLTPKPWGYTVVVRHRDYVHAMRNGVMLPLANETIRLRKGPHFEALILDAQRNPVPDARVRWLCTYDAYAGRETRTGPDGRFAIRAFPPHPIVVLVDGGARGQGFARIPDPASVSEILLDSTRDLEGRVQTVDGEPVAGLRVVAHSRRMDLRTRFLNGIRVLRFPELSRVTTADEQGRFDFESISVRARSLSVLREEPYRVVRFEIEGDVARLIVERAPEIRGRVVDEQGEGIAGARITRSGGGGGWRAHADAEGVFVLRPSVGKDGYATEHHLHVSAPGYADLSVKTEVREPILHLVRAASLRGIVTDEQDVPVAGAWIEAGDQHAWSGPDGRFQVGLRSGKHTVYVRHNRHVPFHVVAEVPRSHPLRVRLKPLVTTTFRGRVVNEDGASVEGVEVALRHEDGGTKHERSGRDGTFEFPSVRSGTYSVRIEAPPHAPFEQKGLALPGASGTTLVLRRGLVLAGLVRNADGSPAAGARVYALPPDGRDRLETRTDARGRFGFEALRDGMHEVVAGVPGTGGCTAWDSRSAMAGDEHVLLRMPPASWVSGRLVGPDGKPLAGVRVLAVSESKALRGVPLYAARRSAVTDARGRFRVEGLAGARCSVSLHRRTSVGEVHAFPPVENVDTERDHEFRFPKGRTLAGKVTGPDGLRVPGARIWLHRGNQTIAVVRTDAFGTYAIHGLDGEAYEVSASAKQVSVGRGAFMPRWHAAQKDLRAGAGPVDLALVVNQQALRFQKALSKDQK